MDSLTIALPLIKKSEGLRLIAYPDPATGGKPYTIGYGATYYENGSPILSGDKITKAQAEKLLQFHAGKAKETVKKLVKSNINPNQEAALISLVFNIGEGNLAKSTLLKKINKDSKDPSINEEFKKWVYANKKIFPGLVGRREEESKLFFKPIVISSVLLAATGLLLFYLLK
jgi:lysozyme